MSRNFTFSFLLLFIFSFNAQAVEPSFPSFPTTNKASLEEGFENWPAEGWKVYSKGGSGWTVGSTDPYEGNSSIARISESFDCDDWIVSPQVKVPENGFLRFFEKNRYLPTYYKLHEVCISIGSPDPNDEEFIVLGNLGIKHEDWTKMEYQLSEYVGKDVYIGFHYQGQFTSDWHLDAFSVFQKFDYDIELSNIKLPHVSFAGSELTPKLTLSNLGSSDSGDFEINLNIGETKLSKTLSLAAGEEKLVSFESFTFNEQVNISATINFDLDQNTSNNEQEMVIRKLEDTALYGFSIYSDESVIPDGPVKFNLSAADAISSLSSTDIGYHQAFAGTMINNLWFCSVHERVMEAKDIPKTKANKGVIEAPRYYAVIDLETGDINPIAQSHHLFKAMSFNPSDNKVYGFCEVNKVQVLYTIDYKTGEVQKVQEGNSNQTYLVSIAIDKTGKAFGIGEDQMLYAVNLTDFSITPIGNTGLSEVLYAQSMTFDYENQKLYWTMCNSKVGNLYEVNHETGLATLIGQLKANAEITSLGIPFDEEKYYSAFSIENESGNALQHLDVKLNEITLATGPQGKVCFMDLTKDQEYEYSISTSNGDIVKSGSILVDKSKVNTIVLNHLEYTDVSVSKLDIPLITFINKKAIVKATIENRGLNDIAVATVTLTAGAKTQTEHISIDQNDSKEIIFEGFEVAAEVDVNIQVEVSNDQILENNSLTKKITPILPKEIYGYCIYSSEGLIPAGPITFQSNMPELVTSLKFASVDDILVRCGAMINNLWFVNNEHSVSEKSNSLEIKGKAKAVEGVSFSLLNLESGEAIHIAETDYAFDVMSYNYANETVYAIGLKNGVFNLFTIAYKTGTVELVKAGNFSDPVIVAFAIDKNGNAFGISKDKYLYAIDLTDFTFKAIGRTGVDEVDYQQSMCFDHASGKLFWSLSNSGEGDLRIVDTETGKSEAIEKLANNVEVVAMGMPYGDEKYYAGIKSIDRENKPIKDAKVTLEDQVKTTDQYGTCVLFDLAKDQSYAIQIEESSYEKVETITIDKNQVFEFCIRPNGIEDLSNDLSKIYPNPANSQVYFKNIKNLTQVELMDLQGKVIIHTDVDSNSSLDISSIKPGVYNLKLISTDHISYQKLIVK